MKKIILIKSIFLILFLNSCASNNAVKLTEEEQYYNEQKLFKTLEELNRCPKGGHHNHQYIGTEPVSYGPKYYVKIYECNKCGNREKRNAY